MPKPSNKTVLQPLLIAPCGMNCGICAHHLALVNDVNKNKEVKMPYCPGCRIKKKFCGHIMKKCSFYKNKKIDACFECKRMPCRTLKRLDNRYTEKYHMSMVENNKYIKKYGLKKFLAWQKKEWECKKCGSLICCHNGLCFKCDLDILKKKRNKYEWKNTNNQKIIWSLAKPYLERGVRKDFILHTKIVINMMKILLNKEGGNEGVMIPAAILHDVGWAKVPIKLQKSKNKKDRLKALKLHIKYASPIIKDVLKKGDFDRKKIFRIIEIVQAHKFVNPKNFEKRLLIDADTLSEVLAEQFKNDMISYGVSARNLYEFRKSNRFYTKTAETIFKKELSERKKEYRLS